MTWFLNFLNNLPISDAGLKLSTIIAISIAIILLFGFILTRITRRLKLPDVTGYILAGILIGPFCLNLIPISSKFVVEFPELPDIINGTKFISSIALAFIAFSVGEYFKLETLKKSGVKVLILTMFEAILAALLVFVAMRFVFKFDFAFSIVISALASATSPASTLMTIMNTKSKGDFVDTLLQVIAIDNLVSLLAYSLAIAIAVASICGGESSGLGGIIMPIVWNLVMIVVGGLFGFALNYLLKKLKDDGSKLILLVCAIFLFCGIVGMVNVSPLLGCMVMGTVYINVSKDNTMFTKLSSFVPPILLIYFVRSGVSCDFGALFSGGNFGTAPLLVVAITYFALRIAGKYLGSYLGSTVLGKSKEVKTYMGLALIPQAGVALGLAEMGASMIGGDAGNALKTIVIAACVLFELVGPASAKFALYMSKSYTTETIELNVPQEKLEEQTKEDNKNIEK